jgi:hypothetical protein
MTLEALKQLLESVRVREALGYRATLVVEGLTLEQFQEIATLARTYVALKEHLGNGLESAYGKQTCQPPNTNDNPGT